MARRVDLSIPDRNISNPLVLDPSDRQESSQRLEALEAAAAFHLPVFSQEVAEFCFGGAWISGVAGALFVKKTSWASIKAIAIALPLLLLIGSTTAFAYTLMEDESTAVRKVVFQAIPTPQATSTMEKEACKHMNELAETTEGSAEELYGAPRWSQMLQGFQKTFELAQDVAHGKVITQITNLEAEAWPQLDHIPHKTANLTAVEEHQHLQELLHSWTKGNFFTIPRLKTEIRTRYAHMHFNQTMEAINLDRSHQFVNDFVAFKHLSLSFLHRSSLPTSCVRILGQEKTASHRLMSFRKNIERRQYSVHLALRRHFDERGEMSKKQYF